MIYSYTQIDGQKVEIHVAKAFEILAKEFLRTTGKTLHVTSGTRTRAQQQALYNLYKEGKGSLAVPPPESHHEADGPVGPRALDVHDSGTDNGVTVANTKRANWLKAHAKQYNFNPAGYGFNPREPWHIEFNGTIGGANKPTKPTGKKMSNPFGISNIEGLQKIANLYNGKTAIDNIWGPKSARGFSQFLRANYGYKGNDVLGPVMWGAIANWLRTRWGYKGNNVPGPVMRGTLSYANEKNLEQLK